MELVRRFLLILMVVPFPGSIVRPKILNLQIKFTCIHCAFHVLFLQYPVFLSVCILATVFSYVQPYKSRLANCLDFLFWLNTIVFFLVFLPEAFHTSVSYNVTDPLSGCPAEESLVYVFIDAIYFMFFSYYLPGFITVVIAGGFIVIAILR